MPRKFKDPNLLRLRRVATVEIEGQPYPVEDRLELLRLGEKELYAYKRGVCRGHAAKVEIYTRRPQAFTRFAEG